MSTPPPKTTRAVVRPATACNAHRSAVDGVRRGRVPDKSAPGEAAGVGDWADEAARAANGLPLLDGDLLDSVASFLETADIARLGRSCKHFGLPGPHDQLSLANSAVLRKLLLDYGIAPGKVVTLSKSTGMPKLGLLNFMQMVNNPIICDLLQKLGFYKFEGFKELMESKMAEIQAAIDKGSAMNAQNEISTAKNKARIAAVEAKNASLAAMNAAMNAENKARIAALEAETTSLKSQARLLEQKLSAKTETSTIAP